jgi:hypothetical protein
MSTPAPSSLTGGKVHPVVWVRDHIKPYLVPYYLTLAGILGAITAVFVVIVVLMILVVTNFNVLGWME